MTTAEKIEIWFQNVETCVVETNNGHSCQMELCKTVIDGFDIEADEFNIFIGGNQILADDFNIHVVFPSQEPILVTSLTDAINMIL